MKWTASVWDVDSAKFIAQYDVPFIKLPSACITDTDLIQELVRIGKPIIMSTGMSTEDEVYQAVDMLGPLLVGILHCNSSYPSKIEELYLSYIKALKEKYPNQMIGYSGHEEGFIPTLIAKAMGAAIIERHITLNKKLPGSDHAASLDPEDLQVLTRLLYDVIRMLGTEQKIIYESELGAREKLRRV